MINTKKSELSMIINVLRKFDDILEAHGLYIHPLYVFKQLSHKFQKAHYNINNPTCKVVTFPLYNKLSIVFGMDTIPGSIQEYFYYRYKDGTKLQDKIKLISYI